MSPLTHIAWTVLLLIPVGFGALALLRIRAGGAGCDRIETRPDDGPAETGSNKAHLAGNARALADALEGQA